MSIVFNRDRRRVCPALIRMVGHGRGRQSEDSPDCEKADEDDRAQAPPLRKLRLLRQQRRSEDRDVDVLPFGPQPGPLEGLLREGIEFFGENSLELKLLELRD